MEMKRSFALGGLALVLLVITLSDAAESSSASAPSVAPSSSPSQGSNKSSSTATQARQSPMSAAASMVGAIGSLVPGLITNVAPLVVLLGIGALMMPSLGMSAMSLLRESRRSAHDQPLGPSVQLSGDTNPFAHFGARPIQTTPQDIYYFTKRSLPSLMSSFNSEPIKAGLLDLLERVVRAIDNADKRYN